MEEIERYHELVGLGHKSPDSAEPVRIVFRNTLRKHICVYWIDHNGRFMLYGIVPFNKTLTIDSYTGHLWCIRHFETGSFFKLRFTHNTETSYILAVPSPEVLVDNNRNYAVCFPIDEVKSLKGILITKFATLPQNVSLEQLPLPGDTIACILMAANFIKNYQTRTKRDFTLAIMQRR